MPLVIIDRDPTVIDDATAINLRNALQKITAEQLSVGDGRISLEEVEVRVRDVGPLDLNSSPLGIEINCGTHPLRVTNRQVIAERIASELLELRLVPLRLLDGGPGQAFVWLRLCDNALADLSKIFHGSQYHGH